MVKLFQKRRNRRPRTSEFKPLSIKRFNEIRNNILVIRHLGGIGDIVMHRYIFESLKKVDEDITITFACPKEFHDFLEGHPYIDNLVDSNTINYADYIISFDTTRCCLRTEYSTSPKVTMNRPDIWAQHCGIKIDNYDMYFDLTDDQKKWGKDKIEEIRNGVYGPSILLSPLSVSMDRSFTNDQIRMMVKNLRKMGYFVFGTHHLPVLVFEELDVPLLKKLPPKNWISIINAADYVVTVDTGTFHIAGGLKKPMTAMFTWTDGKVRGNHYDFILMQNHRDDGWICGPCWVPCKRCEGPYKPCCTELSEDMIMTSINKMLKKWPYQTKVIRDG